MFLPRTYRLRLVVYITVLLVFLVAVLVFSYRGSRALILQVAESNISRVAQQIEGQLGYDARDSRARVKMIRDNVPLTEYLFIAAALELIKEAFSVSTCILTNSGSKVEGSSVYTWSSVFVMFSFWCSAT